MSLTKLKRAIGKGLRESRSRVVFFSVKKKLIFTNSQSNLGMKISMEFSTSSSQSKYHICCLYSRGEQYNVYWVKIYIHVPWRQGIVNGNQSMEPLTWLNGAYSLLNSLLQCFVCSANCIIKYWWKNPKYTHLSIQKLDAIFAWVMKTVVYNESEHCLMNSAVKNYSPAPWM